MKKLLVLITMLSSMVAYGTYAELSATGQNERTGSFYLPSDRNFFRNPALLQQGADRLYLESEKEAGYKNGDFAVAVGRRQMGSSLLDAAFMVNDDVGLGASIEALNGEGVTAYGARVGSSVESVDLYLGMFYKDKTFVDVGFKLPLDDFSLFTQFNSAISDGDSKWTVGLGTVRQVKSVTLFGDVTFVTTSDKDKLVLTAGGRTFVNADVELLASVNRAIFFGSATKVNAGANVFLNKDICLGLSYSVDALSKASPEYKDFDLKASLVVFL